MLTGGTLPQAFPAIMACSVLTGFWLSRRYRLQAQLDGFSRLWLGMAAFSGAVLMAKVPYLIPGLPGFHKADSLLAGGKTILFGMVGGYFAVELAKQQIGLRVSTGDTFVVPVAASIAIGRLACFCGGCCYGLPTRVAWGIVFPHVSQHLRHPTQLYEFLFHLSAAVTAAQLIRRGRFRGQLIKIYFIAYFIFRFLTEFLRPEPIVGGGLTAYQWTSLILIPLFSYLWWRDARRQRLRAQEVHS